MKFYKSRGQHILRNRRIAERIVSYADVRESDTVLEVGCGTGVLTEKLLERAGKVVGIEIDRRFVELLGKKFGEQIDAGKLEVVEGDALKVEFPHFTKFVSNIPYSISSPLTFKLLKHDFESAVVMYQKEFAERLVARKGKNYGRISVIVRAYATPEILEIVSRKNFHPPPKVDSAVVRFLPEPEIEVRDVNAFSDFVTACFSMRRKKLSKAFRLLEKRGFIVPEEIVRKYGDKRAEELEPELYAELFETICSKPASQKTENPAKFCDKKIYM